MTFEFAFRGTYPKAFNLVDSIGILDLRIDLLDSYKGSQKGPFQYEFRILPLLFGSGPNGKLRCRCPSIFMNLLLVFRQLGTLRVPVLLLCLLVFFLFKSLFKLLVNRVRWLYSLLKFTTPLRIFSTQYSYRLSMIFFIPYLHYEESSLSRCSRLLWKRYNF